ncbi:SIMPL domain-containing protein [Novosphingobium sp. P6W]|uniref:SIMPL domain-containing protein n=1 Tax=Novosphingobium sp. P6W TaxID=1609758 RepID=UPI0005C2DB9E|nr:SIMPL domain-containing protein [Novosphingobium sp. P6W]AXB79033.1 DUF541 domain-containing protein [Novosphingobium sp. P6W]KIS30743.1 membrane protein [Novosphingobium sp. P6W]
MFVLRVKTSLFFMPLAALASCGSPPPDGRGVDRDETLLSVSATGEAETRPDQAQFQAGVNSWAKDARLASDANAEKIGEIVSALVATGIAKRDIQTRAVSVQRMDWGDRKGQYQASNVVNVAVRKVADAGAAVAAATQAGANVISGPDLRMTDREGAANSAYAAAFKAARARADAYAEAAGMRVVRILTIRDSGGVQGDRNLPGAVPVAPPPVVMEQAVQQAGNGSLMPGRTVSSVSVQVDFALERK